MKRPATPKVEDLPEIAARATKAGDGGADVVIINTCSVRENAANRLFGNLGQLAEVKRNRPGMQIAVAGCLAQQMGQGIIDRAPWVDVVFGTHNIDVLPALLERSRHNAAAAVELEESLRFSPPPYLPAVKAFMQVGCLSRWAATTPVLSVLCLAAR